MDREKRVYQAYEKVGTRARKTQFYDSWSNSFDQDMLSDGYGGPATAANEVAALYPGDRENVHILDVAAGTGFVGEQLAKHGFIKIDALEPSQGMLDKAKAKGVYQTLICSYFDEKQLDIAQDTYDAIVICGGCANMHLPCGCLWEVLRLVKPGGYFVMVTRPFHINSVEEYNGRLEPLMDNIEKEGKWKNLRKEVFLAITKTMRAFCLYIK